MLMAHGRYYFTSSWASTESFSVFNPVQVGRLHNKTRVSAIHLVSSGQLVELFYVSVKKAKPVTIGIHWAPETCANNCYAAGSPQQASSVVKPMAWCRRVVQHEETGAR